MQTVSEPASGVRLSPAVCAMRALQPAKALLVGAPALAGWFWGGGWSPTTPRIDGILVAAGAVAVALAAFAWNDRADVVRGLARFHRRSAVRDLTKAPEAAIWLLWIGFAAAAVGLLCWARLGVVSLAAACVVVACGWLYSAPRFFGKGRPSAAAWLHLVGGAGNAFAGSAATAGLPESSGWAVSLGLLFWAAHQVHVVSGRQEDRSAGVTTAASERSFAAAASRARTILLGVLVTWLVIGVLMSGTRGTGLVIAGTWMLLWLVPLSWPAARAQASWRTFQLRCRPIVAIGVVLGACHPLLGATTISNHASTGSAASALPPHLAAGIECIERQLQRDNPWPTYVRWTDDGEWAEIHSVFTTAELALGLAQLPPHPRITKLADAALDSLEADRNDDGTWSFYGRPDRVVEREGLAWDITPDADDTARAALALRAWGRPVSDETYAALAAQVEPDGRVRTWFAPPGQQKLTDSNRPDPVVAAAVARALEGSRYTDEVARIRAHLRSVGTPGEIEETTYYRGAPRIEHEMDLALGKATPDDPVAGWPTGHQGDDGCWPLQPSFFGAQEAGRPAYGSRVEPTVAGLVRVQALAPKPTERLQ